jgi:dihydroflavonol-4-reductase
MVAVTGANGLLGSFIVRKLIEEKIPFVAFKRNESDTSLLDDVKDQVSWRTADVLDPVQLEEAFTGVTRVIHAAAVVSYNPRKARYVMDNNVIGTRNVINECLSKGIKRLVHISSVAALGRQKNQKLIDEKNQWVDNPAHTVYGKSKYLAELEVFRAQEEGLNTVIINPSVILAAADWNRSSGKLFKYVWDEKSYYTDAVLNYVDVRDVADITYRLLEGDMISGQRFVVNAGMIHVKDFFDRVSLRFNKKAPDVKLNRTLLNMVARIESLRTWFTREEPLITRETARLTGTSFLYNNTKIKNTLSIEFQPIDTSLDWCCAYFMKKNMHKN